MDAELLSQIQQRLGMATDAFAKASDELKRALDDPQLMVWPETNQELRDTISRVISGMAQANSAVSAVAIRSPGQSDADWQDNCLTNLGESLDDIYAGSRDLDLPGINDLRAGSYEAMKGAAWRELCLANLRLHAASYVTAGRCLLYLLIQAFHAPRVDA